eukprot:4043588-Prymnesium_polylepis.1
MERVETASRKTVLSTAEGTSKLQHPHLIDSTKDGWVNRETTVEQSLRDQTNEPRLHQIAPIRAVNRCQQCKFTPGNAADDVKLVRLRAIRGCARFFMRPSTAAPT